MNRDELVKQLIADEALRLKPYRDTKGKLTIGVGRNLEDRGITKDEAMHLLSNDIAEVCADLDHAFVWWKDMSERRQIVLASMCFQMGLGGLLTFKKTLGAMRVGDYHRAADEMLDSKWAREDSPNRAIRLSAMMRAG